MGVEPVPEKLKAFGFAARRLDANSIDEVLDAPAQAAARQTGRPRVREPAGERRPELRGLREGALHSRRRRRLGRD